MDARSPRCSGTFNTRMILTAVFYARDHADRLRAAALPRSARPLAARRPTRSHWIRRTSSRSTARATSSSSDRMTTILGLSAFYHDSAACLVRDGEIVAAAQEERFTRKKHDAELPAARRRLLPARGAGSRIAELDYVGFYDKPLLKFERILETYLGVAPRGLRSFLKAMPVWLKEKLFTARPDPPRARRLRGPGALHRAPRVARGERLLPVAVRRGRDPHDGRRRRMGDVVVRRRTRRRTSISSPSSTSRTRSACCTRRSPTTPASR